MGYQRYYFIKDFQKHKKTFVLSTVIAGLLICLALLTSFTAKSFHKITEDGAKTQSITITFETASKGVLEQNRTGIIKKFSNQIEDIKFDKNPLATIGNVATHQAKVVVKDSILKKERIQKLMHELRKEPGIIVDLNQRLLDRFALYESLATPLKWSVYIIFTLTILLLIFFMVQQWIHSQAQEISSMVRRGSTLNFIHRRFVWLSLSFGFCASMLGVVLYLASSQILVKGFRKISIHLGESSGFVTQDLAIIVVVITLLTAVVSSFAVKNIIFESSE